MPRSIYDSLTPSRLALNTAGPLDYVSRKWSTVHERFVTARVGARS